MATETSLSVPHPKPVIRVGFWINAGASEAMSAFEVFKEAVAAN
tara:strand:- start:2430 stop:2561 length:132 start_codon:yes stop_codon:yes gene_type:complete